MNEKIIINDGNAFLTYIDLLKNMKFRYYGKIPDKYNYFSANNGEQEIEIRFVNRRCGECGNTIDFNEIMNNVNGDILDAFLKIYFSIFFVCEKCISEIKEFGYTLEYKEYMQRIGKFVDEKSS